MNGEFINDVDIPYDIGEKKINEVENKNKYINNFIFIKSMKNRLENMNNDIDYWVRLIFGDNQRYLSKKKKIK
jgi:hypothetical protein